MASTKQAQQRLIELGYSLGPDGADGIAGRRTQAAVRAFQKYRGIPQTGLLDAATLGLLFPAADGKLVTPVPSKVPLPWMDELLRRKGLHETRNKASLWAWLRSDGKSLGDPSKLPWCGDAVETALALTLPEEPLPANPYLARNWLKFGDRVAPRYGAVLVFWRGSKYGSSGHVGFYAGETATHFKVAGGNQRDSVTFDALLAKGRLLDARWPKTFPITGPGKVTATGGTISTNEA